jgi:membrane-bound lytic murein transglycosylase D
MRYPCLPVITALLLGACSSSPPQDQASPVPGNINQKTTAAKWRLPEVADLRQPTGKDNKRSAARVDIYTEQGDIWEKIRLNLVLQRDLDRNTTQSKLRWYANNQEYLNRVADRATPYIYYIVEQLEQRQMPLDLALLPVVESAYHPFAYSPSRASGIWQFIPGTGQRFGLKQNWWYDGRRDIIAATDAALTYLQELHQEFNGDWLLALAAYNAGEKNVSRALENNRKAGKPVDFWSLKLPRETHGYVPSLLAVAELVADPARYQITLKPITNAPYFQKVEVGSQIDLATVAQLANLGIDEVYTLNPGINHWATDPKGPHYILLPVDKAKPFTEKLAKLSDDERVKWSVHEIRKGDTLGSIAARYHSDITTLRQVNKIKGNTIRVGQSLLIPSARQPLNYYSLSAQARRYGDLSPTGDGQRYLYSIKRGDTLWDISRHYGISVNQLCAWNGISSGSILQPGNKLTVWVKEDQRAEPEIIQVVHTATTEKQERVRYTVKEGDSLWQISRRYGVTVQQLQKWNSLNIRHHLQPGQHLDIYIGKPPTDA